MRQYTVTGMTCAACQSHVEKAVAEVPGVSSVAVALLTNSMAVDRKSTRLNSSHPLSSRMPSSA